jgi:hypothetical protein
MMHTARIRRLLSRLALCLLGALAGASFWALGETWNAAGWPHGAFLAVLVLVSVQASVSLALAGPVAVRRAVPGALLVALPVTLLASWAGHRHDDPMALLDQPWMVSIMALLVFLAAPFLLVWLRQPRKRLSYAALFETAWTMTARYLIAWAFVAVFWALLFLSDAVLSLVEVRVLSDLLEREWLALTLSGTVLGLGLAVVHELSETLSPFLVLRLLRLLVLPVLVVMLVFLGAVPLRGVVNLFGEVSPASTLMVSAIVAISLVSIAVERDDALSVDTCVQRASTRALALTVPFLAGLALWAVSVRVIQHGWTPDRVLAALVCAVLLAYGAGYAAAVLMRGDWTGRIRRVNVVFGGGTMMLCALWLTPVLNADRISSNSQVARFAKGKTNLDGLPLWAMEHDWGKAGQHGLERLAAMTDHPDHAAIVERITHLRDQTNPFRFEQVILDQRAPEELAALVAEMPVQPAGEVLTLAELEGLPDYRRIQWLEACRRVLPGGGPGCVMVRGQFLPGDAPQAMVLFLENGQAHASYVIFDADEIRVHEAYDPVGRSWPLLAPEAIAQAQRGEFQLKPRPGLALHVGGRVLEAGR